MTVRFVPVSIVRVLEAPVVVWKVTVPEDVTKFPVPAISRLPLVVPALVTNILV